MGVYDDWKKDVEDKLSKYNKEEIIGKLPSTIKRCPECHHLSLNYDIETGKIHCSNCGFETFIPLMK